MTKPISKEEAKKAYDAAPKKIKDAFSSEATMTVIENIQNIYNLHVDVAGAIGESVGYMLLGLISPAEFFQELKLQGVGQLTANAILNELNTKIFIPLQQSIKTPNFPNDFPREKATQVTAPAIAFGSSLEPSVHPVDSNIPPYNLINPNAPQNPAQEPVGTPTPALTTPSITLPHYTGPTPARSFQTSSVPTNLPPVFPPKPPAPSITPASTTPSAEQKVVVKENPPTASNTDPYREPV